LNRGIKLSDSFFLFCWFIRFISRGYFHGCSCSYWRTNFIECLHSIYLEM